MKRRNTPARRSRLPVFLLGLIVLLASLVGAFWWWAGTEGSAEFVLQRLAQSQPLAAEGVRGSLRSGLWANRLAWERDGVQVEARDVAVTWRPLALLEGIVKIERLHALSIRITDRRPPSPAPWRPVTLMISPLVQLDDLAIGEIEWNAGRTVQMGRVSGRYWFDGTAHWLRLRRLDFAGGSYRGTASLGALAPLPLDATFMGRFDTDVPGAQSRLPLQFAAQLHGPIEDIQARAWVHAVMSSTTAPPQATATARITPWAAQPVPEAQAELSGLDLAGLWPQAPQTQLAGRIALRPEGTGTWTVSADLSNASPGPWDRQRLPIEQLKGDGQWRDGIALLRHVEARVGGGKVQAAGAWDGATKGWSVKGRVDRVNPAALHSQFASAPLSGPIDLKQANETIAFNVALQAHGRSAIPPRERRPTPASTSAMLRALELRQLSARGEWTDGRLHLPSLQVLASDASLNANVDANIPARSGHGRVELQAPGFAGNVNGELAESHGGGNATVVVADLAQAQRWLARLPALPEFVRETPMAGRAAMRLVWQGGWRDPQVQGSLSAPMLSAQPSGGATTATAAWTVRDASATVEGRLSNAALQAHARAQQGQRNLTFDFAGRGGRAPLRAGGTPAWQGNVTQLALSLQDPAIGRGAWQLALQRPFDVRWSAGPLLDVSAGQALLTAPTASSSTQQAALAWDPVRWRAGELRTAGRLTGLPMSWIEIFGGPQLAGSALSGDMVFDAQWDASLGNVVRLNASIARSRGDVTVMADTEQGASVRVRAGVREARLSVTSQGEAITVAMRWDSERAGVADGRLVTRLARGGSAGWQWPANAPLEGSLRARLPRIGVWSLLAPPGWRLRGSLAADVKATGTRADPQLSGTIAADELALRSVVDGIELRNGRLRAQLEGNRLRVTEFTLHGAGNAAEGGTLTARGEVVLAEGKPQVQASAHLAALRASNRSDRQLTVSGDVTGSMSPAGSEIAGRLRVDHALIVLPDESEPKLGTDVVVRNGAAAPTATAGATREAGAAGTTVAARERDVEPKPSSRPFAMTVDFDLGDDFQVRGRGLQTRLKGVVAVTARDIATPRLAGTITTVGGEYRAYGQRLDVERGVLRFSGPPDNPALDILAIRPNITQRVGVLISGTAQAPFVRLYAEPDLPEAEKLAWLVTGRAAPSTGAETALVQQAALALLSSRRPGSRGIADRVGLDVLSVRNDSAAGPVVTLGKRFARDFYASYERSLSGALGTLSIFYDVSRRFTLRAQAGETAGVDLIFTFSFN